MAVPQHLTGRRLRNRYRLDHLLGSGGMAHVWAATDEVLERQVAVKILHDHLQSDAKFVSRFRAEAVSAARLSHPSIVSMYDQISEPDIEAIVMELITGVTFRSWLDERATTDRAEIDQDTVFHVVGRVSEALDEAHRNGVVHRDIKPSNILLCPDGRVVVADFGIAKASTSADLTDTGALLGTARYVSPEQVRGEELDGRSDVYALSVVLYEALCGRPPFHGNNDLATALARLQGPPVPPRQLAPSLSPELAAVIERGLAVDPDDRFQSAGGLRIALERARAAPHRRAVPTPSKSDSSAPPSSHAAADSAADSYFNRSAGTEPPLTFAESERTWLVPTMVLLFVVVALGVAALLLGVTDAGQRLLDQARDAVGANPEPAPAAFDPTNTAPVPTSIVPTVAAPIGAIVSARSFDPETNDADRAENEDLVDLVFDADPESAWQTEGYTTRAFGNLKSGVGFMIELDEIRSIDRVEVRSSTSGWAMELYVADGPGAGLADWGPAVASASGLGGRATFTDLDGRGQWILVWVTDLGDDPPPVRVRIADITVTSS
ncbi:MAG: serine/threonine protein kinase [Acidimicrobiales bacterium]|nr:serine/threonine protein kinase [Acidimicrobiales bacterium]